MGFCSVFGVFVVLWGVFEVGFAEGEGCVKKFISWDDMKVKVVVGEHRAGLDARDDTNQTRVIVVDKNGGGDSVTVQGAIDMVPDYNSRRVKIYVLPGIYREKVHVPSWKPYISFIGNKSQINETVITWNNKASDRDINGNELGTYRSASVTIESDYFCATAITFEVPIVASTGGLVDTVQEGFTGFQMGAFNVECEAVDPADVVAIETTVKRAIATHNTPALDEIIRNCMAKDLSWKGPAKNWEKMLLSMDVAGSQPGIEGEGEEIAPLARENVATP